MTIVDRSDNELQAHVGAPRHFILRGVAASCASCGSPIEIVPPIPLNRAVAVPDGNTLALLVVEDLVPWAKYGDPSLCISCRIKTTPVDEQEWLSNQYLDLAASASDAGIPAGFPMWPLDTSADDINGPEKWHGFRMRVFAVQVTGVPGNTRLSGVTAFRLDYGGERALEFLVYQIAIYHERIAASLIFRCEPGRGEVQLEIRNWQRVDRSTDLPLLMRGVEIYRAFATRGGRPSTCFKDILETIRALKGQGHNPSRSAVARTMYAYAPDPVSSVKECLRRERTRSGRSTSWPDVVRAAG